MPQVGHKFISDDVVGALFSYPGEWRRFSSRPRVGELSTRGACAQIDQ